MYKKYKIENSDNLEKARIVGEGSYTLTTKNFDYELLLDNIISIESIIRSTSNPYISKINKAKENEKEKTKINNELLSLVKKYGLPQFDDSINISKFINRLLITCKINTLKENIQYAVWDSKVGKEKDDCFTVEKLNCILTGITRLVYGDTKENPVFPKLSYKSTSEAKSGSIMITFASKSVLSILNFYMLLQVSKKNENMNVCQYCHTLFYSENPRKKICERPKCKTERKRLYQKDYRKKKKQNKT